MKQNQHYLRTAAAVLASLLLALAPAITRGAGSGVHGRVFGNDEKGTFLGIVAGAKIEFQNKSGAKVAQATADKDGYYKVELPAGDYLYKIEAPGYRKEEAGRGMRLERNQGYAIFNLALTKGQTDPSHKPLPVPLKKLGKLHGRVLEKLPREPTGIPGAQIVLRREGSRELITVYSRAKAVGTEQVGNYEQTLEVGVYHASVTAAGFERFIDPAPIEIKANQDTQRDFLLSREKPDESPGQGIRGVVTVIDSGKSPPPIKLQIVPIGSASAAPIDVQVAANSSFTRDLPAGHYRVTASAAGFPDASSPPEFVLDGHYTVVNLALHARRVPEPKTNLDVFVFTRVAGRNQPLPLAGASVSLAKAGGAPLTARTGTTDNTGHAHFPVAEAGQYVAEAHLKGYLAASATGSIALGQSHEVGVELTKETAPPAEATLTVLVQDAQSKKALPGASVLARHDEQTLAEAARGTTDAQGLATLRVTRTGNYVVLAQALGHEPGGAKANVVLAQANRLTVGLNAIVPPTGPDTPGTKPDDQPPLTVTGFVAFRDTNGQLSAVPGAKLTWQRTVPARPSLVRYASTGSNGRYEIGIVPATYQVRVEPPTGFEGVTEQVEISKATPEKYFLVRKVDVQPPSTQKTNVKGVVVEESQSGRSAGIAGAEITFLHTAGTASAQSATGGAFGLDLAPDTYRVQVRARGYEPLDSQAQVVPGMAPLRLVLRPIDRSPGGFTLTLNIVERSAARTAALMRPVADAQVQLAGGAAGALGGTTNSAGQYSIRLQPGKYTVRVAKAAYAPASAEISIGNQGVTQQIVLAREESGQPSGETPKPTLTVRVTQRTLQAPAIIAPIGSPLTGAEVTILRGKTPVATGATSRAGIYSVALPAGNYTVKVVAQGYSPAGKAATLTEQNAQVEFQLESVAGGVENRAGGRLPLFNSNTTDQLSPQGGSPYVVEYRVNPQAAWVALGQYKSRQEAQAALSQAIERGRIPRTTETRIKLETK